MINPADPETKHVAEQMAELLLQKQLWPRCETKHAIDPAADGAGPDTKHVRHKRLVSICSREREARETGGAALWQGAWRHRSWRRAQRRDLWRRVSCHVCATSAATRNRYTQLDTIIYDAKMYYLGAIDYGADHWVQRRYWFRQESK